MWCQAALWHNFSVSLCFFLAVSKLTRCYDSHDIDQCVTLLCELCLFPCWYLSLFYAVFCTQHVAQLNSLGSLGGSFSDLSASFFCPSKYRHHVACLEEFTFQYEDRRSNCHLEVLTLRFVFAKMICNACSIVVDFNFLHGSRVGEATNPGPGKKERSNIKLAVCNPHAILSHKRKF